MKQALLVIDVQNDYFAGGKNELYQPDFALVQVNMLAENVQLAFLSSLQNFAQVVTAAKFLEGGIG